MSDKKFEALLQSLGYNVRRGRERIARTQEDMDDRGFGVRWYQRIESGKHSVSLYTLVRLAEELGVEPYELLMPPKTKKPVKKN